MIIFKTIKLSFPLQSCLIFVSIGSKSGYIHIIIRLNDEIKNIYQVFILNLLTHIL